MGCLCIFGFIYLQLLSTVQNILYDHNNDDGAAEKGASLHLLYPIFIGNCHNDYNAW